MNANLWRNYASVNPISCGRMIGKFPDIVTRLADMTERFCTVLDCVDVGFIPDDLLDQLPQPSWIGTTRVGGIDLNKPRIRAALAAVLALSAAPGGFTVADLVSKVNKMTRQANYTIRQAAYDLRKPGCSAVRLPTDIAVAARAWSTNRAGPAAIMCRPRGPASSLPS